MKSNFSDFARYPVPVAISSAVSGSADWISAGKVLIVGKHGNHDREGCCTKSC